MNKVRRNIEAADQLELVARRHAQFHQGGHVVFKHDAMKGEIDFKVIEVLTVALVEGPRENLALEVLKEAGGMRVYFKCISAEESASVILGPDRRNRFCFLYV